MVPGVEEVPSEDVLGETEPWLNVADSPSLGLRESECMHIYLSAQMEHIPNTVVQTK